MHLLNKILHVSLVFSSSSYRTENIRIRKKTKRNVSCCPYLKENAACMTEQTSSPAHLSSLGVICSNNRTQFLLLSRNFSLPSFQLRSKQKLSSESTKHIVIDFLKSLTSVDISCFSINQSKAFKFYANLYFKGLTCYFSHANTYPFFFFLTP